MNQQRIEELELKLSSAVPASTEHIDAINELAWAVWINDPERAATLAKEGFRLAGDTNYARGIAFATRNRGFIHYWKGQVDEALPLVDEALKWFRENGEMAAEAHLRQTLSGLFWGFGDFQKGFDLLQESLRLYESIEDREGAGWSQAALGNFHYDLKDYPNALKHFELALQTMSDANILTGIARARNGIGLVYYGMQDYQAALAQQEESLRLQRGEKNRLGESKTLNDIGLIYQRMGDPERALSYHVQSLAIREELKYIAGQITSLLDIADIRIASEDFSRALADLKNALALAEKINQKMKSCRAHKRLSKIYEKTGDHQKALAHYKEFHKIDEQVFQEDTEKKFQNMKAVYEREASLKEAEIHRVRNGELKTRNLELEEMLRKIHAAQAQVIQAGKMAALGNLITGVAHEIDRPIHTINAQTEVIKDFASQVDSFISRSNGRLAEQDKGALAKTVELLQTNTMNMQTATRRVIDIVRSLRSFTRTSDTPLERTNIHECIDNTLTLIRSRISEKIRIEKEYGQLPEIFIFREELNVVFMNLMLNALEATPGAGVISIHTSHLDAAVTIRIADTGIGIPQEMLHELFEPGFTTQDARVKMRTGLYSSFNIVSRHRGTISVESRPGEGTTFALKIPDHLEKLLS